MTETRKTANRLKDKLQFSDSKYRTAISGILRNKG